MISDRPRIDELPPSDETGQLGVFHLKRLWARKMAARNGVRLRSNEREHHFDHLVLHASGVGLEQAIQHLMQSAPSFEEFERWIQETTGGIAPAQVARINAAISGAEIPEETQRWLASIDAAAPVLTAEDLAFWEENGYVIVRNAVSPESRAAAEKAVWNYVGADPEDAESWYRRRNNRIMVQLFQHPAFEANRRSPRVHKAFAQLWGTSDLWVTTDRCGFNVPEREGWKFPGPDLHWDTSLQRPIPFGTQGILYLVDTPAEQGAFTLVPGLHNRIEDWLASLPEGADARTQDLHALGSTPIAAKAGDLIIWHHSLPHGSRPNRGTRPRIVQYIDMFPTEPGPEREWI